MLTQNVYCAKCQHCIGFRFGFDIMPAIYCLECESAVVADLAKREQDHARWQDALNNANVRPIR